MSRSTPTPRGALPSMPRSPSLGSVSTGASSAERLKEIQSHMDMADQVEKEFPQGKGEHPREYQERIMPEVVSRLPRLPALPKISSETYLRNEIRRRQKSQL